MEEQMGKRYFLFIGLVTLALILLGCAGPDRLETDYGTSFKLLKLNQILNPDAEKNSEPVAGLDGKAAQANIEKFRKDFEKPAPPTPYSLSIGISGKK
jgi:hypothetical protein